VAGFITLRILDKDKIADVFSAFHDGSFSGLEKRNKSIVVYSNEHLFNDSLGGEISFQIDSIQVYDEKMRSITYAQLQEAND